MDNNQECIDYKVGEENKPELTDREISYLELVAEGYTNKQIAEESHYSESAIQKNLSNIYRKLGVNNRTKAAAWYVRNFETQNESN